MSANACAVMPQGQQHTDDSQGTDPYYMYQEIGIFGKIARSNFFQTAGVVSTSMYMIWFAVDIDFNDAHRLMDASMTFQIVHWAFSLYFATEASVEVLALRSKRDLLFAPIHWIRFDVVMAFLLFLSGLVSSPLLQLAQCARIAKLLAVLPECLILVKGFVTALRSVFCTALLQVQVLYVFGLALRIVTKNTEVGNHTFSNVPESMLSLICPPNGIWALASSLKEASAAALVIYFLFLYMTFCILVVLAGVLCEVVSTVASIEKENLFGSYLLSGLRGVLQDLDPEGKFWTDESRFVELLNNASVRKILQTCGVDPAEVASAAPVLFDRRAPVASPAELTQALTRFSCHSNATYKDVIAFRKAMKEP